MRGNTIMRAHQMFEHLDWIRGGTAANGAIAQVYNSLLEPRGCDFDDSGLVPSLAKSWEIGPDGLS